MVLRDVIPNLLNKLSCEKLNKNNKIIHNLTVTETNYLVNEKFNSIGGGSSKHSKDQNESNESEVEFGGITLPYMTYDFQLTCTQTDYHCGSYWLYVEEEINSEEKKEIGDLNRKDVRILKDFGILYNTKLFTSNSEYWLVANLDTLNEPSRKRSVKSILIRKILSKNIHNLYHIEFYNLFMHYKAKNALGLFFFHFITDGIRCAKMTTFEDLEYLKEELQNLEFNYEEKSVVKGSTKESILSQLDDRSKDGSSSTSSKLAQKDQKEKEKKIKMLKTKLIDFEIISEFQEFY